MNWHFCIDSTEKRALNLCHGSMNEDDGLGHGDGYSGGYGDGDGYGNGYGYGYGDGNGYGDGYGRGWGNLRGGGYSPQEWR